MYIWDNSFLAFPCDPRGVIAKNRHPPHTLKKKTRYYRVSLQVHNMRPLPDHHRVPEIKPASHPVCRLSDRLYLRISAQIPLQVIHYPVNRTVSAACPLSSASCGESWGSLWGRSWREGDGQVRGQFPSIRSSSQTASIPMFPPATRKVVIELTQGLPTRYQPTC